MEGAKLALHFSTGQAAPYQDGLDCLSFSRDLLDWTIRRRLSQFPTVQFLQGSAVTQLLPNPDQTGSRWGGRATAGDQAHPDCSPERPIEADFVVDASGKGSQAPRWLRRLGYEPPAETVVNAHITYGHCLYQLPPQVQLDWQAILILATPPDPYSGWRSCFRWRAIAGWSDSVVVVMTLYPLTMQGI